MKFLALILSIGVAMAATNQQATRIGPAVGGLVRKPANKSGNTN
jgi:hypothetical protein